MYNFPGCCSQNRHLALYSGATGIAGSLAMVPPLFLLLRHREAMETIGYALDLDLLSEELRRNAAEARRTLATNIYAHRHKWKPWVYASVALQLCAAVLVVLRFCCLIAI